MPGRHQKPREFSCSVSSCDIEETEKAPRYPGGRLQGGSGRAQRDLGPARALEPIREDRAQWTRNWRGQARSAYAPKTVVQSGRRERLLLGTSGNCGGHRAKVAHGTNGFRSQSGAYQVLAVCFAESQPYNSRPSLVATNSTFA